ncbi:MAG: CvpA family protein [Bacillota bacterium]
MSILDIVIVVLLCVGAVDGARRGFVRLILGMAALVGALAAGVIGAKPLAVWVDSRYGVVVKVSKWLLRYLHIPQEFLSARLEVTGLESFLEELAVLRVPRAYTQVITGVIENDLKRVLATGVQTWGEMLAYAVANLIVIAAAFLIIFILVRMLISVLAGLVTVSIDRTPVGWANSALGLVAGFAKQALIIAILLGLVSSLVTVPGMDWLSQQIGSSKLSHYFLTTFYKLIRLVPGTGLVEQTGAFHGILYPGV